MTEDRFRMIWITVWAGVALLFLVAYLTLGQSPSTPRETSRAQPTRPPMYVPCQGGGFDTPSEKAECRAKYPAPVVTPYPAWMLIQTTINGKAVTCVRPRDANTLPRECWDKDGVYLSP